LFGIVNPFIAGDVINPSGYPIAVISCGASDFSLQQPFYLWHNPCLFL